MKLHRLLFGIALFVTFSIFNFQLSIPTAQAVGLTLRYKHYLFPLIPDASWYSLEERWTYEGKDITPNPEWRSDGDEALTLPEGVSHSLVRDWNRNAIRGMLQQKVAKALNRPAGEVVIRKNSSGAIVFDGVGLTGREVDIDQATTLVLAGITNGATDVLLPVEETQPKITVEDPELLNQGIREVVTVGESDFSNSPKARRHNIAVGLAKFNGHLIPAGSIFSFDQILGRVDGSTGYWKELVIKGDRTEPDYGGGLCQVSTTAYRGIWEYGFPVTQRKNHSYTVSHYFPQGTDATVYPPSADMKFKNDSATPLLIQTYEEGDNAYFIYYGTRDERMTELYGPFIWDRVAPPADREELTTEIPAGTRKKVGERVPGLKALWFRLVDKGDGKKTPERVFSVYEARPLFYLVGMEGPTTGSGDTFPNDAADISKPPRAF